MWCPRWPTSPGTCAGRGGGTARSATTRTTAAADRRRGPAGGGGRRQGGRPGRGRRRGRPRHGRRRVGAIRPRGEHARAGGTSRSSSGCARRRACPSSSNAATAGRPWARWPSARAGGRSTPSSSPCWKGSAAASSRTGRLLAGRDGSAGEIGHTRVSEDGPPVRLRRRAAAWKPTCAPARLAALWRGAIPRQARGDSASTARRPTTSSPGCSAAARDGDGRAREILADAAARPGPRPGQRGQPAQPRTDHPRRPVRRSRRPPAGSLEARPAALRPAASCSRGSRSGSAELGEIVDLPRRSPPRPRPTLRLSLGRGPVVEAERDQDDVSHGIGDPIMSLLVRRIEAQIVDHPVAARGRSSRSWAATRRPVT